MTKTELEEKIENGESVWVVDLKNKIITENKRHKHFKKLLTTQRENRIPFDRIFTTRRQAEHYLHHANISRTEQLPFYTFSEIAKDEKNFKMGKTYTLIEDKNFVLDINKSYVSQIVLYTGKEKYSWNFNEENFYKAYDECVRLFRGEE